MDEVRQVKADQSITCFILLSNRSCVCQVFNPRRCESPSHESHDSFRSEPMCIDCAPHNCKLVLRHRSSCAAATPVWWKGRGRDGGRETAPTLPQQHHHCSDKVTHIFPSEAAPSFDELLILPDSLQAGNSCFEIHSIKQGCFLTEWSLLYIVAAAEETSVLSVSSPQALQNRNTLCEPPLLCPFTSYTNVCLKDAENSVVLLSLSLPSILT